MTTACALCRRNDHGAPSPGGAAPGRLFSWRPAAKNRLLAAGLLLLPAARARGENLVYPAEARGVIDVTRPPYSCDNTGTRDCTEALIRALDDIVRPSRDGQRAIEKEMAADPRAEFVHPSSVENRRRAGRTSVIFPARLAPARILYFPNGTYLVSDTVCYTLTDLHNSLGNELSRQIVIRGQSEAGTVLRLRDECPGFATGAQKPVLSFILKDRSNVAMANLCENLTIDVGRGNPGAAGLRFYSNNMGAVRRVTLRSSDPQGRGSAGLLLDRENISCALFQDVTIAGFDCGVLVLPNRINAVFEHICLSGQRVTGFVVHDMLVSLRDLRSVNAVPALALTGPAGQVVIVDSELRGTGTDGRASAAIEQSGGMIFARDVRTPGYDSALASFGRAILRGPEIDEYCSTRGFRLSGQAPPRSLRLPVEETPSPPWEQDLQQWMSVNACGAKGDGTTDDTAAIQRALDAGRRVVWFQPGQYLIDGQLSVPATVQRLNFMFADLAAGPRLRRLTDQGAFKIMGESPAPLVIEDLFAFEELQGAQYLIEHASRRTLVLRNLELQLCAMYTNSVPGGKVFLENVATTDEASPNPNCFTFRGQQVWARQLNPERAAPQVLNDGSRLWVLGMKTESGGIGYLTRNGGATELLGGVMNRVFADSPIVNEDSDVAAILGGLGWPEGERAVVIERMGGEERTLLRSALPKRVLFRPKAPLSGYVEQCFLPLYVGRRE